MKDFCLLLFFLMTYKMMSSVKSEDERRDVGNLKRKLIKSWVQRSPIKKHSREGKNSGIAERGVC